MDKLMSYLVGIAIPMTLYFSIIEIREVAGIGGITSTLKIIGLGHKVNLGIGILIIIGVLSFDITRFVFSKWYLRKIRKAVTKEDMIDEKQIYSKIDTYYITESLKNCLKHTVLSKS